MRILGLILLVGGYLVWRLTQSAIMDTLGWVFMGLGLVVVIISYVTKKK